MGAVLIKCPVTGHEFATGIQTDAFSLLEAHEVIVEINCA